jgi:hypothetical protein
MTRGRKPQETTQAADRWCGVCDDITLHRLHSTGYVKVDGTMRMRWRCVPCDHRRYYLRARRNGETP